MTTIGVVVGCYNHERYVEECLESVLGQTVRPDRIVVVDDGSDDDSRSIVARYEAAGVELLTCDRAGPSVVFNTGVAAAETEIVAIISADDACLPHRLERQRWLIERRGVDLVLGLPIVIDEHSHPRSDAMAAEFFEPFSSGRGPMLRQLFLTGNFLCAATATFRRSTFLELGGFHPGLLQLQDFHLWLRWSWRRMLVVDERLSAYRKTDGTLSSPRNDRRMNAERVWVYRHLFDDIPDDVVADAFPGHQSAANRNRMLDVALVYLAHPDPLIYQLGCELVLDLVDDAQGRLALSAYGFDMQDVFAWTAASDVNRTAARDALLEEAIEARAGSACADADEAHAGTISSRA